MVGQGHHHGERGRGHERLLGAGAVPPDVVDRSRAGMGCHGMQAYFVQLVHVAANLVCLNFDTIRNRKTIIDALKTRTFTINLF